MVALWILGILFVLLILLMSSYVRIFVAFGEKLQVTLQIGWKKITILPRPEKAKNTTKNKTEKKKVNAKKEPEKKKFKPTFQDIRSGIPALFESLKKGLRKTRRHLVVDPMDLSLILGDSDPSKVAQMYGWVDMAIWTMMPQLEQLLRMPDPHIHLDVDYNAPTTKIEGRVGIKLRIGHLAIIGGAFGLPLLKWLRQTKKNSNKNESHTKTNIQ